MQSNFPRYFVDVILPLALPKTYTYYLTEEQFIKLRPGHRVTVSFGKEKIYTAIVKKTHNKIPKVYEPKPIHTILDEIPIVTETQLNFWEWLSTYYMCSEGEILKASIPSALLLESKTVIEKCGTTKEQLNSLTDLEFLVYEGLQKQNLTLLEISKITDLKKVLPLVMNLINKKVAVIKQRVDEKFKSKKERVVQLSSTYQKDKNLEKLFSDLNTAPKQKAIILALVDNSKNLSSWVKVSTLKEIANISSGPIKYLIDKDILNERYVEINRNLIRKKKYENVVKKLSSFQKSAFKELNHQLLNRDVVLLEGVTASGKTEVYISLIEKHINQGKQILYLVPEISLTSQIVTRLESRFGDKVIVYHSRFSIHERTEVWRQVLNDDSKGLIIVGARSSILLPFKNLSLVIVDEEHENSYKQIDPAPRYQARDSIIYLANKVKAKVVLGSATPSIETTENVQNKKYGYVKLTQRYGGVSLPKIELINLKQSYKKKKMKGMFSDSLISSIQETLNLNKQVILFQNRRGYAPFLECVSCGHSPQCVQCDVSLTYHQISNQLKCHYCGYSIPMPNQCNSCGMLTLNTKGVGTQQIENQINEFFPEIKVGRMDWDSTRGKWDFDKIIDSFEKEEVQILVGTQMVVKGLDFKNVLLVGVINADHILNSPDFRSHERSYQMLCQVAGRAGRSDQKGKVMIQTYDPENLTLKQVIENDYEGLFNIEKKERIQYHYPPYYRMIKITFKSRQFDIINKSSNWFLNVLKQSYNGTVLGPTFPEVSRVRNFYNKELLVKVDSNLKPSSLKILLKKIYRSFQSISTFRNVRVNFDVDPY